MIVALDTDVLVHWLMKGSPLHARSKSFVRGHLQANSTNRIGLCPQVIHEFLHVSTDPRRFEFPLEMTGALELARRLWNTAETHRILPAPQVVQRTLELMRLYGLGRKRILDTALAAALESDGVNHLASFNQRDFVLFDFLVVLTP